MSSPEHKQLVWNLINDIKVGMLVTKEKSGDDSMRARPMHLVQDDYDGTLYFFTPKDDAKVFEIEQDRDVCITFSNPERNIYVSMTGKAELTDDQELIDKYWNEWAAAWFEGGKQDPQLGMLKVKIKRGEHWDTKESEMIQMFEVAKAKEKEASTPDIGETKNLVSIAKVEQKRTPKNEPGVVPGFFMPSVKIIVNYMAVLKPQSCRQKLPNFILTKSHLE